MINQGFFQQPQVGLAYFFSILYTHIIQRWEEFIFGLNLELHRFDAFLRLEATVQLYIEVAGKILGWSFTFGVGSLKICYKKGTLKNLTTPNVHTNHTQDENFKGKQALT